jgi:hypothetical protein
VTTTKAKPKSSFDLDAAIKESKPEVESQFSFDYQGVTWTFRPASQTDARLLASDELTDIQQIMVYFKDLLGEDQWAKFPRITFASAMMVLDAFNADSQGTDLGEAEASTDS